MPRPILDRIPFGRGGKYPAHVRIRAILRHIRQKVALNTLGRLFVSPQGPRIRQHISQLKAPVRRPQVKVGILAHAYYVDIVPEILALRSVFDDVVPLHLTVPHDKLPSLQSLVGHEPDVVLHPCENRGRDIAPFLSVLDSGALDGFDAVLKLHTKRSPHLRDGEVRRKLLFAMLCGERNATYRALTAFEDAATGMVGWRDCFRTDPVYWMDNEPSVRDISHRMAADEQLRLGFFEGSMFWFRPAAMQPLRALHLKPSDFEPEARQLDGTLHHAIERCFTIAAWAGGFSVRDMKGRVL